MKKAIQIAYNEQFSKKCRYAAEAGFRHIAVNYTEIIGKTEDQWKQITEDIQRILEQNGLSCVQSHPHFYNPYQSSEITDEATEFAIRQSIISSAAVGAEYCVIHPRTAITSGYRPSVSLADNKKWFGELLECAVKYGTKIAAENLPIFPSVKSIRPLFSSSPDHLIDLVDYFEDENICVCWDFGHANLTCGEQGQVPMIEALGSRIQCTHVHNNWGTRDDHAPPVYGNIDWKGAMAAMAAWGYDGPLTLETHCWYEEENLLRSFAKHNYESLVYLESLMGETV